MQMEIVSYSLEGKKQSLQSNVHLLKNRVAVMEPNVFSFLLFTFLPRIFK